MATREEDEKMLEKTAIQFRQAATLDPLVVAGMALYKLVMYQMNGLEGEERTGRLRSVLLNVQLLQELILQELGIAYEKKDIVGPEQ